METLLAKWTNYEVAYAKLNAQGLTMLRMLHAVTDGATWAQKQAFARYQADLMACFASEEDYLNYIEERERPKPAVKRVPVPQPLPPSVPPPSKPPIVIPRPQPRPTPKPVNAPAGQKKGFDQWDEMTSEEQLEFVRNNPHLVR